MNNSLRNSGSLASNFPADCKIPHLENNLYIYGGGPPYKPQPCRYSPPKYVPNTEKLNQQDFGYSELYSRLNSKGLRSTNPYSSGFGSSNSPSKDIIPSYRNENKAEALKSSVRKEEALYRTPRNTEKNLNSEQLEYNLNYLKPSERSGGVSYRSQEGMRGKEGVKSTEKDRMEEFHLLSSGYKINVIGSDQEKVQDLYRKEQLLRESELQARKQLEYEQYLIRKNQEQAENDRKLREKQQHEQHIARRYEQEEYERQQARKRQELYEQEKQRHEQVEYENHLKRVQHLHKQDESHNNYTPNSLKSSHPENHEALKQQIGRESRQFYREKQTKNSPFKTPETKKDYSSPRENNFTEPRSQQRGSSTKSLKSKMRSLSNKKNDAHYFQHTFSTKVKSMANQPYTFANSTKSTVSRQS